MGKLEQKYVEKFFRERGCELLSLYQNSQTKMKYRCSCGNLSEINWTNFKHGKRCKVCGKEKNVAGKRIPRADVAAYFQSQGCQLLDDYTSTNKPMKFRCSCGRISEQTYTAFRKGSRCQNCRYNKVSASLALGFDFVKKFFEDHNCELLETEYKNARTKMKYRCQCGQLSNIVFDSFRRGNRCQECRRHKLSVKFSGEGHPNWNSNRQQASENLFFRKRCCDLVKRVLKCLNQQKADKTFALLGYNTNDLKNHIFNHSNWPLVKNGEWSIDHIFPVKAFLDYGIKDIKIINCLENLQPLSRQANLAKQGKYNCLEFEKWLIEHKILF